MKLGSADLSNVRADPEETFNGERRRGSVCMWVCILHVICNSIPSSNGVSHIVICLPLLYARVEFSDEVSRPGGVKLGSADLSNVRADPEETFNGERRREGVCVMWVCI